MYTYATWVAAIANETVIDPADTNFLAQISSSIDYGEMRLYRDLDLLSTVVRDIGTLSANTRIFNLPSNLGRFVVTNGFNVFTPVGTVTTRNPLVPCSRDVLDMLWPSLTGAGIPSLYAMITDQQIIMGPAPDQAYSIEVIGTIRPAPLSASNTTTALTLYLPDLWFAATMIFWSGYQHNWGAQSDDPRQAVSWESQYQALLASANVEEQRKRYAAGQWSSMQPAPLATPPR